MILFKTQLDKFNGAFETFILGSVFEILSIEVYETFLNNLIFMLKALQFDRDFRKHFTFNKF